MDTLIKIVNFNDIKTKNKSRLNFFFNEILKHKDIPISLLSDTNITKILDGLYIKNNIIPCKLIGFVSDDKNTYITDNSIYSKYKTLFITSQNVIEKINKIINGCDNFMSQIENKYINNLITNIYIKITDHQKKLRKDDKMSYIKTYSHFLSLRESLFILKNEIYNDFNNVYLETLYLKYNILTYETLEDIFNELIKLETDYNYICIPFSIIINGDKQDFSVRNIIELLEIMDSNITNYNIEIIHNK